MHLGSVYLIVKDFKVSVTFYEKLLGMKVSKQNMERFAMFEFEGNCICLMNAYFDVEHPDKVVHKGLYEDYYDNMVEIANLPNSRKAVLNFWVEDLRSEYNKFLEMNLSSRMTKIKYICNVCPYYYFHMTDPDGNIIEVTGDYQPDENEWQ